MELIIKIGEINYGDAAVKVMPLLGNAFEGSNNAVAKTVRAISQLPENLIYSIFDEIPMAQKNETISTFAMEYTEKILYIINKMSEDHRIGVTLSDFTMNQDLEVSATIDRIDYPCIVDRFLPKIQEKLLSMGGMMRVLRPVIEKASSEQMCGILERLVDDNKGFMITLINQNQKVLTSLIEDVANKQNIHLKINSIFIQE